MSCVDDLAELLRLIVGKSRSYDWAAIERHLGLALPNDYKQIVETFPDGRFQGFIRVMRPGDNNRSESEFLGFHAYALEDMREWQEEEPERFPYPLYPEPRGLLPWGESGRGDLFFWLASGVDPGEWSIVATDTNFSEWNEFDVTLCSFLVNVVSGRFDGEPYEVDLSARAPWLKLIH